MNHNTKVLTAILTTLGTLLAGPLPAADEALLDVLLKNGVITKAQREALAAGKKGPAKPAEAISAKPAPPEDQGLLDVLLENGLISQAQFAALQVKTAQQKRTEHEARASLKDGIKLKSQDGAFQAQIGAYAQLDSAFYSDDPTDFSDATQLRRTRLAVYGTVYQDWDYKVEADFAGTTTGGSFNDVTITDAYLRYTGFKPFSFTAGNFKVPFSLEAVSSAKYITFMERGLPFAFLTLRALGGMAAANGDNWTASLGAFGGTVTTDNDDDEGKSVASRITYAPYFQSDRVLHFGASGAWSKPQQNAPADPTEPCSADNPCNETVRFRSKPESNPINDPITGGPPRGHRQYPGRCTVLLPGRRRAGGRLRAAVVPGRIHSHGRRPQRRRQPGVRRLLRLCELVFDRRVAQLQGRQGDLRHPRPQQAVLADHRRARCLGARRPL